MKCFEVNPPSVAVSLITFPKHFEIFLICIVDCFLIYITVCCESHPIFFIRLLVLHNQNKQSGCCVIKTGLQLQLTVIHFCFSLDFSQALNYKHFTVQQLQYLVECQLVKVLTASQNTQSQSCNPPFAKFIDSLSQNMTDQKSCKTFCF